MSLRDRARNLLDRLLRRPDNPPAPPDVPDNGGPMLPIPKNWKAYLIWGVIAGGLLIGGSFLGIRLPIPNPPDPVWQPGPDNFGWVKDPGAVAVVTAKLRFKAFADTPAGKVADPLPDQVCLWQSYRRLFNRGPPSRNQGSIGSCVSFGTSTAVERTMVAAIIRGEKFEYRDTVQEAVYGGSRVQIGGGRLRGDGSVGAWAADWVHKFGILDRGKHGSYDLSAYDIPRCRDWGNRGVPADLIDEIKTHPVKEITQVKTWDEAKRALAQGYGVAICSGQGFSMQRDSNGVCRASGSWAHCMALDGYQIQAGQEYGHIENSWGPDAHTGPVGWGDPPTSGFWAASATVSRMLGEGDSWAFSTVQGFPRKELDWFVARPPVSRYAQLRRESDALRN